MVRCSPVGSTSTERGSKDEALVCVETGQLIWSLYRWVEEAMRNLRQIVEMCASLLMIVVVGCAASAPTARAPQPPAAPGALAPNLSLGDGGVSGFYSLDGPPPTRPGVMIRTEPLPAQLLLTNAAVGRRILYSSTNGLDGRSPVAVSGALFVPQGSAPPGGWPLIAWAHGTVGIADVCAPSWQGRSPRDVAYLNQWLAQGYAIVATDYQGLGVPGGHPYLDTRAEAYSVLDSVRAAQSGADPISKKVVVVGQSQGGGAAVATAGLVTTYAPDLDLVGTVATGTPYFAPGHAPVKRGAAATGADLAYEVFMLYLAEQTDPNFRIDQHVTPAALPVVRTAQTQCLAEVAQAATTAHLSATTTFNGGVEAVLGPYFPLMSYDTLTLTGPVFLGVGGADATVAPANQQRLASDACAAGSTIELHIYPGLDHSPTVNASLVDSIPFARKAFAGQPITGNCHR